MTFSEVLRRWYLCSPGKLSEERDAGEYIWEISENWADSFSSLSPKSTFAFLTYLMLLSFPCVAAFHIPTDGSLCSLCRVTWLHSTTPTHLEKRELAATWARLWSLCCWKGKWNQATMILAPLAKAWHTAQELLLYLVLHVFFKPILRDWFEGWPWLVTQMHPLLCWKKCH